MVNVDFVMTEYTDATELTDFAQVEACCKIASEITRMGPVYGWDFWFVEALWNEKGHRILRFEFNDEHEAMLIKLRGVEKD